jgi:hypothetical protein
MKTVVTGAFVDDAGLKRLTECESCGEEKYVVEGQTACDECRSHGGKIRPKRKVKSRDVGLGNLLGPNTNWNSPGRLYFILVVR